MYSNKENVNILTALLVKHGVRHAVVCPGSRNAPVVHNLNECPEIECHPVTDERSAGFYALGMSQYLDEPVVVCVTSGTALLNLLPAVAEAYYQHIRLVVVSADRPQAWIDQLDGQTLPQPDALGRFVRKAVSLPEIHTDEDRWYCNRLVNEAMIQRHGPVHVNVPISEPLFEFTVSHLPDERMIDFDEAVVSPAVLNSIADKIRSSKRPMIISGQPLNKLWDEAVAWIGEDERYVPDFVLYTGGSLVSKRLKRFLRQAKETWVVNDAGEVTDTFMNLTKVIQGDGEAVAEKMRPMLEQQMNSFDRSWGEVLSHVVRSVKTYQPPFSQMAAVRYLEEHVTNETLHYANSSAIRLANIYACHPIYCNRGVNGIEGSLSTAAGFSVVTEGHVVCVIGDLSFFYDQNALWNQNLRGNLRILLLNNGKGGIFNMLKGLEQSPARDRLVAAQHSTSAEGICQQNHVGYRKAQDMDEMQQGINWLLSSSAHRPMLLEVFTDAAADERALKDYYEQIPR